MHNLSTRLFAWSQSDKIPIGETSRLLLKLPLCRTEAIFTLCKFTLRYGPRSQVFFHPVGTARMDEKDLECRISQSIHQYAAAFLLGHRFTAKTTPPRLSALLWGASATNKLPRD